MATINKTIERVDRERINVFDTESKFQWLSNLDGVIARVVMQQEPVQYEYPDDLDRELLVKEPWDSLYGLYLEAMIDYHNREYNNYNASMTMFNSQFDEFKKTYIRENMPKSAGKIKNL